MYKSFTKSSCLGPSVIIRNAATKDVLTLLHSISVLPICAVSEN